MPKTLTICGSMRFAEEMKHSAKMLEKKGYTILQPEYFDKAAALTENQISAFGETHLRKIFESD